VYKGKGRLAWAKNMEMFCLYKLVESWRRGFVSCFGLKVFAWAKDARVGGQGGLVAYSGDGQEEDDDEDDEEMCHWRGEESVCDMGDSFYPNTLAKMEMKHRTQGETWEGRIDRNQRTWKNKTP
jgi:hypothetical protein